VIEQSKLSDTKFVFGTLISGKSVHYPGNVILIGDINPGAEIIAEGNIVVMGRILGFVHAGSAGLESAVIVANLLKPTQIRIAKFISVPPSDDHSEHTLSPEIASVSKGIIKIEKCH
jgi:septum site-determining protein MinC